MTTLFFLIFFWFSFSGHSSFSLNPISYLEILSHYCFCYVTGLCSSSTGRCTDSTCDSTTTNFRYSRVRCEKKYSKYKRSDKNTQKKEEALCSKNSKINYKKFRKVWKWIQYNTIQYNRIQYNITKYNTILYTTILYYTILYYTILYDTILHYTILAYTILHYTIIYYNILYYTILYYTILYYTILYYTIRYDTILY